MYTTHTAENAAKIMGEGKRLLTTPEVKSAVDIPGTRVYGYLERGECANQIVRLTSRASVEGFSDDLGLAWSIEENSAATTFTNIRKA